MKGILKLFMLLLSAGIFVRCEEEIYIAPDDLVDATWYFSQLPGDGFVVAEQGYLTFADLSQGTLSHQWIIDSGAFFLQEGFDVNDSLPLYIDYEQGRSTEDAYAHIVFMSPGLHEVRLINTFPDSVTYTGSTPLNAVRQEGNEEVWVIDTAFVVDVYGFIKPAFDIYKGSLEVAGGQQSPVVEDLIVSVREDDQVSIADSANWNTATIEAGEVIFLVDKTTTDRPENFQLFMPGGKNLGVLQDSLRAVSFGTIGTFTGGTYRVSRTSDDLPQTSTTKQVPLRVVTTAPQSPLILLSTELMQNDDRSITLEISGQLDEDAVINPSEFIVNAKNGGFNGAISVSNVVPSSDRLSLTLNFADAVYNTDTLTVSYNGSSITSFTRPLQAFSNIPVINFYGENRFKEDWRSFEIGNASENGALVADFFVGGANKLGGGILAWQRTIERSFVGEASFKYTSLATELHSANVRGFNTEDGTTLETGQYLLSVMIYLEPSNILETLRFQNSGSSGNRYFMDLKDLPRGRWVQASIIADYVIGGRLDFQVPPENNQITVTEPQIFYMDELSMQLLEPRP
ncbi:MAG: hypothetical protein AAF789_12610 [Bacteroidota bacterium]